MLSLDSSEFFDSHWQRGARLPGSPSGQVTRVVQLSSVYNVSRDGKEVGRRLG